MRRIVRRRQKQVEAVAEAAEKSLDTNFVGRFDRIVKVRRFALGWLTLTALATICTVVQTVNLGAYYQTTQPVPGGTYNEGMVGAYSNANPIFATGAVDVAASQLLFAGLFRYDDRNQLVGELATGYQVDPTGKHYTISLRPGLTWHDGKPLTAEDVAFTYRLIQNPDVRSPLQASWQGITVRATDKLTVVFDLPNVYSAFPHSLLTGIVPKHILSGVPAAQLRSDPFNTVRPVGAGPFMWQALEVKNATDPDKIVSLVALQHFSKYASGEPLLSAFVLHAYGSKEEMVTAFHNREINAMTGLNSIPELLQDDDSVRATSFASTAAMMTFFKTTEGALSNATVRKALVQGANTDKVINNLDYVTRPVRSPLLMGQLAYDPAYAQATFNAAGAKAALEADGWVRGNDGIRTKDGQRLAFRLYAEDTDENQRTVSSLVRDWHFLGAEVTPVLQSQTDFQTTVQFHTYDALLYGISIGPDPDVYAYWDSKQADIRSTARLNFSEYQSTVADGALEAGRTRLDPELRVVKYKPFLQAWQADAPALGLYQPRFLYITRGTVYGLSDRTLNTDADRYDSVVDWQMRTAKVTNE